MLKLLDLNFSFLAYEMRVLKGDTMYCWGKKPKRQIKLFPLHPHHYLLSPKTLVSQGRSVATKTLWCSNTHYMNGSYYPSVVMGVRERMAGPDLLPGPGCSVLKQQTQATGLVGDTQVTVIPHVRRQDIIYVHRQC